MPQNQPPAEVMKELLVSYDQQDYAHTETRAYELLQTYPESSAVWKFLGRALQQQGKNPLNAYRRVAELNPGDAEAYYNLGMAQNNLGLLSEALESFRKALVIKPDFAEAYFNKGNLLRGLRRLFEAAMNYRQALRIKPDFAEALHSMGIVLKDMGRLEAALASCRQALVILPDYAEAHHSVGLVLKELGRLDEAVASYQQALRIKPDFAEAHDSMGVVLKNKGQLEASLASCRQALAILPDFAAAHHSLGLVLKKLGQLDQAMTSMRRAVELKPDFAEAHDSLGDVLETLGYPEEARASHQRALQIKHVAAEEYNKQGVVLYERGQIQGAVTCYRLALKLKPDYVRAYSNLGNALKELGELDAALQSFQRAEQLQLDFLQHAISRYLLLPVIPKSTGEIAEWRERYQKGIAALMDAPGKLHEPGGQLDSVSFYLAYHNADDRPLMEGLCRLFRARVPELNLTAPHVPGWQSPAARGQRIRVGFLSEFLCEHTIGKHYQGFIRHLDRRRFEVVVIHGNKSKQDPFRQNLNSFADKVVLLPVGLKNQQRLVANEQLDALFFPDIGMAPSTYFLAYSRLAPVQATSWGHPDTSGLDTMDYYVSASSNEAEGSDKYYTERLVRLNRLPCFYFKTSPASIPVLSKAALGLPESGTLYGCPQSLFKIHPDFDAVLAVIAEGDPTGHLIIPEGKYAAWTELLKARWAKTFPVLLKSVKFMPGMFWDRFMASVAHMDMLLDPLYFGSGNTMYDAMISGTPVVTWPGRFARGRNVAAAYRQMGVADAPVASNLEDYAPLALALAKDPERRSALREASRVAASQELFEDLQAVREFELFLESAVAAAAQRAMLPVGWKPPIH